MARSSSTRKSAADKPRGKAPAKKAAPKKAPTKASTAKARKQTAQRKRRAEERKRKADMPNEKALVLAREGLTGAAKTVENAELYLNVYRDWLRGMTGQALAAKHGLSIRRIEQIVSDLRGQNVQALRLRDPRLGQRIAHDLILRWSSAISEYVQLIDNTTNESVKLGAMRMRDQAVEGYTSLMQELGYLPKHLGTLRIVEDWDAMIEAILETLDKHGVGMDVQRAIVDAVEKVNTRAPLADAEADAEEITDAVLAA